MEKNTITVVQMEKFREELIENEKAEATLEKYMKEIQRFATYLGERALVKSELLAYRKHLLEQYQVRTVNGKLTVIRMFLKSIGSSDLKIKSMKIQQRSFECEERNLSNEEYERLLEAAKKKKSRRLYYIIQTIHGSGIRISELAYITVASVHTGRVHIRMKGKNREILLTRKLREQLEQYIHKERIQTGPVFRTRTGKPVDRSNICHEMKALSEEALVSKKKIFPHNLRHLFARNFYRVRKDLAYVADILGHSSLETTRIYVRTSAEEHEKLLEQMEEWDRKTTEYRFCGK